MKILIAPVAWLLLAASSAAFAEDCAPQVHEGWIRMPPAQMPMMAGFGRIQNDCATHSVVVAASSPAFGSVELHETRMVDGVSRMRHVPELRIARDEAAVLRPGGLHLMLMQPKATVQEGDRITVELELAGGRRITGEFEVRKSAGR